MKINLDKTGLSYIYNLCKGSSFLKRLSIALEFEILVFEFIISNILFQYVQRI